MTSASELKLAVPAQRSFLRDAASVLGSNLTVAAVGFLTSVVLARQLGPQGQGILVSLLVFPILLHSLAEMGIRQATVHHLGKKTWPEDEIVGVVLALLLASSLVGVAACLAIYRLLDNHNFTPGMIALALCSIPLALAKSYASGILLGKQRIGQFNRVKWLPAVARLAAVVALVWAAGFFVIGALWATIVSGLPAAVYALWLVARVAPLRPRWNLPLARQMLGLGAVYAFSLFLISLNYKLDIVLLERLTTAADIGRYAVGVQVAELLWQLPAALGIVVFARSASARDPRQFSRQVAKLLRVTLVAAAAIAGLVFLAAAYVVPAVYSEQFRESVVILRILLPGTVAMLAAKILYTDLAGKGKPWAAAWFMVPAVSLNLVLNLTLIPLYGANGAAVATAVSYAVASLAAIAVYSTIAGIPLTEMFRYRIGDFEFLLRGARRPPSDAAPLS